MSKFPKPLNIMIQNVTPVIDGGRFAIKREPMDRTIVSADLFRHSHEKIDAAVIFRRRGEKKWHKSPMTQGNNDRWTGEFVVTELGYYEYAVSAWTISPKDKVHRSNVYELRVDPTYARVGAWYEIFPRSQGQVEGAWGTWVDCKNRLGEIKDMGFDVIYTVPIHPIGVTNRKGPNNSLICNEGDPGCNYAIGSSEGGHFHTDPNLGTQEQFEDFMSSARKMGFQMALDIALNCSPDHPHVKTNPEWYYHEEDGSIKFAENPPKKYEDIYPYDYYNENHQALWEEIRDMLLHWVDQGFTIFRIDNPHTKPFPFWEWVISEVKTKHPQTVFLSEAFTRPKVMQYLAKLGFDQSYTYFTWRTDKFEMREYCEELTQSPLTEYMRGNFFPTTPDILPEHLQNAPREMFILRLLLASTLSSSYGMVNGYELCENKPFPNKEEYWNSEKYDFKVRDWNAEGNIKDWVKKFNQIRNEHPALQEYDNLRFHDCNNDQIMVYSKRHEVTNDCMLFIVNFDIENSQSGEIVLNLEDLGLSNRREYQVTDTFDGASYTWNGTTNFVVLDPKNGPGHAFSVHQKG